MSEPEMKSIEEIKHMISHLTRVILVSEQKNLPLDNKEELKGMIKGLEWALEPSEYDQELV